MKRYIRGIALVFGLILFTSIGQLHAGTGKKLVVLHTNDFHGHPLAFYNYPAPEVGGLPAIATLVNQIRSDYRNVLVLDAGDLNTGRPESNFFKAIPDIIGYNFIGYDAVTLGNHEFDRSLDILRTQMNIASFPFLSANVKTADGELLTRPYVIKSFGELTVGVFGLTTKDTKIIGNPDIVRHLIFEDELTTARDMVKTLRNQVDILIALTHLGIWKDTSKGAERIAANVDGIDLIIDGHTHTRLDAPLMTHGTPIVQAWQWGLTVGKAVFEVGAGNITSFEWETLPVNLKKRIKKEDGTTEYQYIGQHYPPDPFLREILTPYAKQVDTLLSEEIGEAASTFFVRDIRKKETALGNLVADAMAWYGKSIGVDFAIQNGGGIRADLPEGKITKRLIYEVLPFDNTVVILKLTGRQISDLIKYVATIEPGNGAFPQVSGSLRMSLSTENKSIAAATIGQQVIDPDRLYTVATNSYLAAGGDGYTILKRGVDLYDTSKFQRDVVIEYIQFLGGQIAPGISGRIKLVN